jgi:hypothetical protein
MNPVRNLFPKHLLAYYRKFECLAFYSARAACAFSFLVFCTVGRTPGPGDQPAVRQLPTHSTTQRENKRTQTFMPRVGFETTIPKFERAKTVHALDRLFLLIKIFCLATDVVPLSVSRLLHRHKCFRAVR